MGQLLPIGQNKVCHSGLRMNDESKFPFFGKSIPVIVGTLFPLTSEGHGQISLF